MVLGPQALLSAAVNPVLSVYFSPAPMALQRRKPELQGLKTAVAVFRGSPLASFLTSFCEEKLTSTMPHALKISGGRPGSRGGAPGGSNSSCSARVGALWPARTQCRAHTRWRRGATGGAVRLGGRREEIVDAPLCRRYKIWWAGRGCLADPRSTQARCTASAYGHQGVLGGVVQAQLLPANNRVDFILLRSCSTC